MIKILFYNLDTAGVNYYRTTTPAKQLELDHNDKFEVHILNDISQDKLGSLEWMKTKLTGYDIVHFHKQLHPNPEAQTLLENYLRSQGTKLVMDIDDYWKLDKHHPAYSPNNTYYKVILTNLKNADYVTTTTNLLASQISKEAGVPMSKIMVLPNAVNPEVMPQFKDNKNTDSERVRLTYMAGSSHGNDVRQLDGTFNMINADNMLSDKYRMIVAGWDTNGQTTQITATPFFDEFIRNKIASKEIGLKEVGQIMRCGGDLNRLTFLSNEERLFLKDKAFRHTKRPLKTHESVYLQYENIFTDNHKIIKDKNYLNWLLKFSKDEYPDVSKQNYSRVWTKNVNIYAKVLDETDIALAPLADNIFNRMKSNLKQVECWTRKIPIICSDIPPYNVDGLNEKNCLLVPVKKRSEKGWYKAIKRLVLNPSLREDLGNQLYEDFKDKYDLKNVTNNRANFYSDIV